MIQDGWENEPIKIKTSKKKKKRNVDLIEFVKKSKRPVKVKHKDGKIYMVEWHRYCYYVWHIQDYHRKGLYHQYRFNDWLGNCKIVND